MASFLDSLNPFSSGFGSAILDPLDFSGHQKRQEKRKLRQIEQKRSRLEQSRQAVQTLRQSQVERAKLLQLGANRGVSESSGVQGGLGSIQSQTGANIGFANQIFSLNQQAGQRIAQLGKLQDLTKAGMTIGSFFLGGIGGAVAGAAMSGASSGGTSLGTGPELGGSNGSIDHHSNF